MKSLLFPLPHKATFNPQIHVDMVALKSYGQEELQSVVERIGESSNADIVIHNDKYEGKRSFKKTVKKYNLLIFKKKIITYVYREGNNKKNPKVFTIRFTEQKWGF